ncbi:alcohol oxidase [Pholiota molesta]|nr:alcohol oxidase [Pholiota molesta]
MPIVSVEQFKLIKFDYLILGGGTAGLTLAARLSEDKDVMVGVIEAGTHHNNIPEINVPGLIGKTIFHPTYDWSFFSVPQAHAGGVPVLQPRGKGLGGSSMNNFLGMFRPSREEFDALEKLGNKGWNWESLLGYMKKSETTFSGDFSASDEEKYAVKPDSAFHGMNGPIKKSFPTTFTEQHALLFDAAEALGIPRNSEMANGTNVGSMTSFTSVDPRTAKRSYAAPEYYEPNASRSNLAVLINSQVTKIVFVKGDNGLQTATAVEFIHEEVQHVVDGVQREIILSAGTFQTPQLLELSGIGNSKILQAHGITPIIDLPGVGENLQDHVCVRSVFEIDSTFETMDVLSDPVDLAKHQELYKQQKGLLSLVPAQGFIFVSSKDLGAPEDIRAWKEKAAVLLNNHLEAITAPALANGLQKQFELQKSWSTQDHLAQAEEKIRHPRQRPYAPLSRGTAHIGSSNPLAPPLIDPNYFGNEADLDLLVHITKLTLKLVATPPMAGIVRSHVLPSSEVVGDEQKLRQYVKENSGPVFHPVGTAAMLPREDGGVVDSELRVYGTNKLRIVDLSILPMELGCHTQSVAYAIGEKAADILSK